MYQQLTIVGNLGRDPEARYLPDGTAISAFSVAANERVKGEDRTTWFRVTVWGKQAETCNKHLTKGWLVLVEGTLTADDGGGPRVWTDRAGNNRASFEVRADRVRFLRGAAEPVSNGEGELEQDAIPF